MKRTMRWSVQVAAVTALTMLAVDYPAAAQFLDPLPAGDEAVEEAELPVPGQSGEIVQPPRDFSRAYLGVKFEPQIRGAVVARSVSAGSPADEAGVQAGDTIETVNGQRVSNYAEVMRIVNSLRPGDVLDIGISRRVSVRARAVLDGQPLQEERTVGYPSETPSDDYPVPQYLAPTQEPLPTPSDLQIPRRPAPRQNFIRPDIDSGRGNLERGDQPPERDRGERVRGRFSRRRR